MRLKDELRGIIPDDTLCHLTNHFEVIGDIAILSLRPELNAHKKQIAGAILSRKKNIRTVINKVSKIDGGFRTAQYEFLAGTKTLTCHREYGLTYRLDIGKVFFNSRLAYERKRVNNQVQPDEWVFVPFCGVGPYVIPAAARYAKVVAMDRNPDACRYLSENIWLNSVARNVCIIKGSAFDTCLRRFPVFNQAIVPTPYGMDEVLDGIVPLVKKSGMIHFYTFKTRQQIPMLMIEYKRKGLHVKFFRPCGNVAPGVHRWVFDLVKTDP
jgi:tRNA (guanine37-N1)-methyltransferase